MTETVDRYEQDMDGSMEPHSDGSWVHMEDYYELLEKYELLKSKAASFDGWVKTSDSLPAFGTSVLIVHWGKCKVGVFRHDKGDWESSIAPFEYWCCPYDDWEFDDVTHWRPLPQVPDLKIIEEENEK